MAVHGEHTSILRTDIVVCSGVVDVTDVVLLCRYLAEDDTAVITEEGKKNADCDGIAGLTNSDGTRILQLVAKLITKDQMGKKL